MAHAISDAAIIRSIRGRSTSRRDRMEAAANKLESLTVAVENRWEILSPADKEYITSLAYGIAKDPEPLPVYLWPVAAALWLVFWPVRLYNGERHQQASERLGRSMGQFVDAVFNAIEREQSQPRAGLSDAIRSAQDPKLRSEVKAAPSVGRRRTKSRRSTTTRIAFKPS